MCKLIVVFKSFVKGSSITASFKVFDMLLDPAQTIWFTFTQLEYSATLNTIISLSVKAIRTVIAVTLISPFCTGIAQVVSGVLLFVSMMVIRIAKYKVVDKQLVVTKKKS